jgi:hypothetical protein
MGFAFIGDPGTKEAADACLSIKGDSVLGLGDTFADVTEVAEAGDVGLERAAGLVCFSRLSPSDGACWCSPTNWTLSWSTLEGSLGVGDEELPSMREPESGGEVALSWGRIDCLLCGDPNGTQLDNGTDVTHSGSVGAVLPSDLIVRWDMESGTGELLAGVAVSMQFVQ